MEEFASSTPKFIESFYKQRSIKSKTKKIILTIFFSMYSLFIYRGVQTCGAFPKQYQIVMGRCKRKAVCILFCTIMRTGNCFPSSGQFHFRYSYPWPCWERTFVDGIITCQYWSSRLSKYWETILNLLLNIRFSGVLLEKCVSSCGLYLLLGFVNVSSFDEI